MSEIHETINMCVCVKVLSCDPKGDHVTFKWKKKSAKVNLMRSTCIDSIIHD